MITIIAIIGKTSSGKDTIAKYLEHQYGIEPIVSYTDRKMRSGEENGREHWFVTKEEMDALVEDSANLLAYTQFPKTGIRYCASSSVLEDGRCFTYIINPDGIEWLKEHRSDVRLISIYVDLEENVIRERAKKRGDDVQAIEARLDSEREQFDMYKHSGVWDCLIYTNQPRYIVEKDVDHIIGKLKRL